MLRTPHAVLATLAVASLALAGCQRAADEPPAEAPAESPAAAEAVTELQVTTLREGDGPAIAAGQQAIVHYTGWLHAPEREDAKGTQFDSSRPRGVPFDFPLGAGRVIPGWEAGVEGMQVGELRRLIIPPGMAYGSRGAGGVIPPDATLLFEVELLGIE
jgi:FKBP-type peptidyl-prolyl cis-trans isomerase FkpA